GRIVSPSPSLCGIAAESPAATEERIPSRIDFSPPPPKSRVRKATQWRRFEGSRGMGEIVRILGKVLKWLVALVVLVVAGVAGWLYFSPPALIRVATAYSAKIVCSNQFLAWRDGQEVLALDVQAPGHPILKYIAVDVDTADRTASAKLLGLFGEGRAVYRQGAGCSSVPYGTEAQAIPSVPEPGTPNMAALWPAGERVEPSQDPALAAILD